MVARTLSNEGFTCWCVPVLRFKSIPGSWGWWTKSRCIELRTRAACSISPGLCLAAAPPNGSGMARTVRRSRFSFIWGWRNWMSRSLFLPSSRSRNIPESLLLLLLLLWLLRLCCCCCCCSCCCCCCCCWSSGFAHPINPEPIELLPLQLEAHRESTAYKNIALWAILRIFVQEPSLKLDITCKMGSAVGGNSRHLPFAGATGVHWNLNACALAAWPSWETSRESTMNTWHDVNPRSNKKNQKMPR